MSYAVFLDRDGTLNIDHDHVFQVERVELVPSAPDAIKELKKLNYLNIIVSNQSCIGRGYAEIHQVEACMNKVKELLLEAHPEAVIDAHFYAPDHPDNPTFRRKPAPGMIYEARDIYQIDLIKSWIIGDKISDPECGLAAGIPKERCILIEPNSMLGSLKQSTILKAKDKGFSYFPTITEAVAYIKATDQT